MPNMNVTVQHAKVAAWFMELPSGEIAFDPIKAEQLGYDPDDPRFQHYTGFTDLIHPDDIGETMEAMRRHLRGEVVYYKTTYRIKAADGSWHTYSDQGVIQSKDDAGNISLFGATMDIS